MEEKYHITRAAGLMSIATFISRILGYIKDMVLAKFFGATGIADTFFVAFRIPNLLRELFAEGSMSSAFIPVLTEYREKHGEEEARRLVRINLTFFHFFTGHRHYHCAWFFEFAGEIPADRTPDENNVSFSSFYKPRLPCDGRTE